MEVKLNEYDYYRPVVERLYNNSAKKSYKIIHQKLREKGERVLLATVKRIINDIEQKQVQTKVKTKDKQIYPIIVAEPNRKWQIDIMYMTETPDKQFKYILNAIDAFSRYVFSFPIVKKDSETVLKHLAPLIDRYNVREINTDNGTEFLGVFKDFLDSRHIIHRTGQAYNSTAQSIVERFNLTLRRALIGHNKWATDLPKIIKEYNHEHHNTIKMKPMEAFFNEEKQQLAYENITNRAKRLISKTESKVKFQPNDKVRIVLFDKKNPLSKKSTQQNWSDEVFLVEKTVERENGEYVKLVDVDKLFTKNQLLKVTTQSHFDQFGKPKSAH